LSGTTPFFPASGPVTGSFNGLNPKSNFLALEAMAWSPDFIYLLRVQMERQDVQYFPSLREYHRLYGITDARLEEIRKRGLYLMHPGPVNRGVELCDAVMDYERSLINDQVENGIAVRMAVLYWLKPGGES
jgi:aspartate carbamoyltransferase catalytic subunit